MGTLTVTGYEITTQNEYFAQETQLYLDIDPLWNLDPSTPDGLKIAHDAEVFSNLDELALAAYNSKDPNSARGVDLDIIGSLTGATRDDGSASTVVLTLGGVNGTLIAAGSIAESTSDSSQWRTLADVTIVGGVASASAENIVNGAVSADIGTITNIVSTVGGWQTVTNAVIAVPGANEQTNPEFRLVREVTVGRPGNNQVDSMLGELGTVDNIGRFRIYENDTALTDANGLTQHSIAILAEGGTDADIAIAMFIKKNPGVTLHPASTPVQVLVTSTIHPTNSKTMTFSRPLLVDMIVVLNIINDGSLSVANIPAIQQAIITYSTGNLVASDQGFNSNGFPIGGDVSISRLFTPVNQVIGALGNSNINLLTVNGVASSGSVAIPFNSLSNWLASNITVNLL